MTGRAGQTLRTRHSLQPDRARFALCARRSALAGQAGRSRRSGGAHLPALAHDHAALFLRRAQGRDARRRMVDDAKLEVAALVRLGRELAVESNFGLWLVGGAQDPQLSTRDPSGLDLDPRQSGRNKAHGCYTDTG
ncbi:hypothetical protein KHHGKMAE_3921 [Methylobacterium persicinum]|nr:hypothetical protein KHHGKMAE_3921 [Methylobacterium persicinum]